MLLLQVHTFFFSAFHYAGGPGKDPVLHLVGYVR
jgi:hypothetical protein